MGASGVYIGLLIAFYVAIPIAMAIPSFVIGSQWVGTPCAQQAVVPLSTWLFAYGGVQLGIAVFGVAAILLLISEHYSSTAVAGVGMALSGLFMFAWNIVGGVALFRDAHTCLDQAYPLWAMTLAVLIMQWIGMVATCCTGKSSTD